MLACVRALRRVMASRHMANWLIWRIDCGKLAYGEKAYGKMTSYQVRLGWVRFVIHSWQTCMVGKLVLANLHWMKDHGIICV